MRRNRLWQHSSLRNIRTFMFELPYCHGFILIKLPETRRVIGWWRKPSQTTKDTNVNGGSSVHVATYLYTQQIPDFFKIDSIKSDFFNGCYTHYSYYTLTATLVGFFTSGTQSLLPLSSAYLSVWFILIFVMEICSDGLQRPYKVVGNKPLAFSWQKIVRAYTLKQCIHHQTSDLK